MFFQSTRMIIGQIDEFFDSISQSGLTFLEAVKDYLSGEKQMFMIHHEGIKKLEGHADVLRRSIENDLYSHSLMPEHRGDVMGLLEFLDDVIDTAKELIFQLEIENPEIPDSLKEKFLELATTSSQAVDAIVKASRAFFRNPKMVKDDLHKVYFYEREADKISYLIKKNIFQNDKLNHSQKLHLKNIAHNIDSVADKAEIVADKLTIYAIKQMS